ncbi:MAG: hypothetical protein IKW52_05675 [Alistipes sp.]|nr:hypothetical protein [Alistipes sp.]
MKKFIYFMLVLLGVGFVGCDKEEHDSYYVMYFTARVVDEAGEPIQGIHSYLVEEEFNGRSGYSDYLGEISGFVHASPYISGDVVFEDIDGEYNGGCFESVTLNIKSKMIGWDNTPDNWGYTGSAVISVGEVVMKRAKLE